jgi:ankyrin repeat protein
MNASDEATVAEKTLFDDGLSVADVHALVARFGRDVVSRVRDAKTRFSPLMHPTHSAAVLRVLIEYGANVNYVAKRGLTPLMTCRSADAARVLLAAGARVDAFDAARFTALMHSVDDVDKLTALLDAGADVNWLVKGRTALSLAVRNWPAVRLLLARGASPNVLAFEDQRHFTPLHVARTADWVRALVQAGAALEALDYDKNTPLLTAAGIDVVRALLQAGADPNAVNVNRCRPLHRAVTPEWVHLLAAAGADGRMAFDSAGRTPLMTLQPSAHLFRAFVDAGVDINAVDRRGLSVLRYGHAMPAHNLRMLVELGANIDHPFVLNDHARNVQSLLFLLACNVHVPPTYTTWLLPESRDLIFAAGCLVVQTERAPRVDAPTMVLARQRIQRARLDLIRREASNICIALQSMELPAWVTLQIVECACAPFAVCVPLFVKWNLITSIKHFRSSRQSQSVSAAAGLSNN